MSGSTRTIEAARVTCHIISLLQERGTAGISEIAEELGRSKSSVHAYLSTLVDEKYVVKENHRYSLSLRHLELGQHVKHRIERNDIVYSETNKLAEITNEVAHFATIEQGDLVYLSKARGKSDIETPSAVGSREPLHATSLGKAILSHLTRNRVVDIVGPGPLPRETDNTIIDIDALFEELRESRERGYAIDDEEHNFGLRSIAAPVILDEGVVVGAVGITGPVSRMSFDRIENELEDRVERAANIVQINAEYAAADSPTLGIDHGLIPDYQSDSGSDSAQDSRVPEPTDVLQETVFAEAVESGPCRIQPVHSEKALGIHAGSTADGSHLQQHSWDDEERQRFQFTRLSDGTYRIDAVHSGKPIEVENASTVSGATVQQSTWVDGDHQKWRIERLGDTETFRVVNVNSGKVIDVVGESVEDGASTVQWSWTGGRHQRFRF